VKVCVALLGGGVVLTGLVLVPLPGPGWVIVFAGVAIWAVEFHWARRLLAVGHRYLGRSGRVVREVPLPVRVLAVALVLAVVALLMWSSWRYGIQGA
jgi:uncharacterized protein (TIGR02611 family)